MKIAFNQYIDLIMRHSLISYRYRPDLIDLTTLKGLSVEQCNDRAFTIIERELGIPKALTAAESVTLEGVEPKVWLNYLEQVCEVFRGEVPHVKHPKLDLDKLREAKTNVAPDFSRLLKFTSHSARKFKSPSKELDRPSRDDERPRRSRRAVDNSAGNTPSATPDVPNRRSRKRRSYDKTGNIVSYPNQILNTFKHSYFKFEAKSIDLLFSHTKKIKYK